MFRTWMLFVAAVAGVLLMVLACHRSAAEPGGPPKGRPYGLQKRLPWTTSRIVGSLDPLPPFRVERAFPNLKLNYPIAVAHQPGSDRLLLITATQSYGPVKIERIVDDPKTNKVETLLELDAVAYRAVFAPNAVGRVRLRIERLVLRWTAGLKNEDDRLGAFAARRWRGLRLKTEQVGEASSDQAERADLK